MVSVSAIKTAAKYGMLNVRKKGVCRPNNIIINDIHCASPLGKFCWKNEMCATNNAVCIDNECQCNKQHIQFDNQCILSK